ncbi:hypothetical protein QBC35DRAFT_546306 [Podospora australis]|uniref:Cyanovirin-N domain-containing protein n=1 Tax=Podospora australis TaxID=1536484 RepID=A0AAN6WJT0_9PEZI|nr:hypothetical protein QBC35DRAFT_546306 [Podospora australis]
MKTFFNIFVALALAATVLATPIDTAEEHANITRRDWIEPSCGGFATANNLQVSLAMHREQSMHYDIKPWACNRIACGANSGLFICNHHGRHLTIKRADAQDGFNRILHKCCPYSKGVGNFAISGKQEGLWGSDVYYVVAYSNCAKDANNSDPDQPKYPYPGVNGECR